MAHLLKASALLFIAFGGVFTLLDRVWVALGMLEYPTLGPGKQPPWVVLLLGGAGTGAVLTYRFLSRWLLKGSARAGEDHARAVLFGAAWFVAAHVGGVFYGGKYPVVYLIVLSAIWLVRVLLMRLPFPELLLVVGFSLAMGVAGVVGEGMACKMGMMYYPVGPLFRVPLWLPGIWLQAGLWARALARAWFGASEAGNPPKLRFFPLRLHAFVDYLVPLTLFGVPLLFTFPANARTVAFTVAAIHLSMTLLTNYPGGVIKLIPFRIHLFAELILGPCLVAMPWLLGYSSHLLSTALCAGWGTISFLSFFVTQRTAPPR